MPKEGGSHCIRQSVILIDSVFEIGETIIYRCFLEECKYTVK